MDCSYTHRCMYLIIHPLYTPVAPGTHVFLFFTIWEFAQSRDCIAHSQNLRLCTMVVWSRDCAIHLRNLEIARNICMSSSFLLRGSGNSECWCYIYTVVGCLSPATNLPFQMVMVRPPIPQLVRRVTWRKKEREMTTLHRESSTSWQSSWMEKYALPSHSEQVVLILCLCILSGAVNYHMLHSKLLIIWILNNWSLRPRTEWICWFACE